MEQYSVTGMSCAACSSHVEKAVSKVPGVTFCSVNLLTNSMRVDGSAATEEIIAAVERAGYGASLKDAEISHGGKNKNSMTGDAAAAVKRQAQAEESVMRWRLGISIGCLIPLMYISMHHMFYEWFGLPVPEFVMHAFHGVENAVTFAFAQFLFP